MCVFVSYIESCHFEAARKHTPALIMTLFHLGVPVNQYARKLELVQQLLILTILTRQNVCHEDCSWEKYELSSTMWKHTLHHSDIVMWWRIWKKGYVLAADDLFKQRVIQPVGNPGSLWPAISKMWLLCTLHIKMCLLYSASKNVSTPSLYLYLRIKITL